jgi:hypothetical protein
VLGQHRGLFNQYWAWSEDWVALSLDTGVMRTAFGWTCRTGIIDFNARSISNWPVQIGAVLSKSQPMIDLYATGQPYIEFAKRFDAAPPSATKKTRAEVHET